MKINTLKSILIFLLVITVNFGYSQVGIGNTDPQGALDVTSSNNGLLIPRIALSATNIATVITPTVSELVYNTFTSAVGPNQITPGFYYWDGSLWVSISTSNSNKMFSGFYNVPSLSDNTTKNLCTLAQSGGWVVNLVGTGGGWQQNFTIANTNTFSLSGSNTMFTNLTSDLSGGSNITSGRTDILYQKDVTLTPLIGLASYALYLTQGSIEAWTNDGSSKMTLNWWGHEYATKTIRWNITITNR